MEIWANFIGCIPSSEANNNNSKTLSAKSIIPTSISKEFVTLIRGVFDVNQLYKEPGLNQLKMGVDQLKDYFNRNNKKICAVAVSSKILKPYSPLN